MGNNHIHYDMWEVITHSGGLALTLMGLLYSRLISRFQVWDMHIITSFVITVSAMQCPHIEL